MAKRVIHTLVDDIDGSDATDTIRFAVEGVEYEIDLNSKNAAKLQAALKPFVEAGTRLGRINRALTPGGRASTLSRIDPEQRDRNREIRDWLTAAGFEVPNRGRIRGELVELYDQRNSLGSTAKVRALLAVYGTEQARADIAGTAKKSTVPAQKAAPDAAFTAPVNGKPVSRSTRSRATAQ